MMRHGLKTPSVKAPQTGGFTLLEVVIAIIIFGFLLSYVAQLMNSQLKFYNSATQKNELEQKVRTATTKIVDQVRFSPKTYYSNGGIYSEDLTDSSMNYCLVHADPNLDLKTLPSYTSNLGIIYWDSSDDKLLYRKGAEDENPVVLADGITAFKLTPVDSSGNTLVKLEITASNSKTTNSYRLVTWVGLYYGQ